MTKNGKTRPDKITLEVPPKDLEYNYMGYETEYFSHMPIVEANFSELRSLSLSKKTKHNRTKDGFYERDR